VMEHERRRVLFVVCVPLSTRLNVLKAIANGSALLYFSLLVNPAVAD